MSTRRASFSYSRLPIARKLVLIVTATTLGALLLASMSIVAYDAWDARRALRRELAILGQIVADRSLAALSFKDSDSAHETLRALGARPSILEAALLDADGETLARFMRSEDDATTPDRRVDFPAPGLHFEAGKLQLVRPIELEGETLGTLILISDLRDLHERQARFIGIMIAVAALSFAVVFWLSARVRREASMPVSSLAESARRVTNERDYSARVEKRTEDEVGELVDAFNAMLEELARRDLALQAERDRAEEHAGRARQLFEETAQAKKALEAQIAERERLEQAILQSEKMEAVGRLAGGVAHDFNNMLMVIRSYVETILVDRDFPDRLRADLEEIDHAAVRAETVTRQLLLFSRQQVLKTKTIDLNETVRETLKMLERLIGEDVMMRPELSEEKCLVRGDETQLQRVLMNLIVNARDAMPTGGELCVSTRRVELKVGPESETLDVEPGDYSVMAISDTGEGMSEEVRSRVFDPFFTTKAPDKGTGLGLSSVYGIVRQSGGAIRLDSEVGRGSSFEIYLPLATHPTTAEIKPTVRAVRSGSETVLLVEDEAPVRRIVEEMLTRNGYRVLAAADGLAALEVSRAHDGPIDLVITDVVMPRMNADELIAQLDAERPGIPILFISGYVDDVISRYGVETWSRRLLGKPFVEAELLEKIREILDTAEG
jgi:signal transduction histidine kinase/CheY-like chemotaxis protein